MPDPVTLFVVGDPEDSKYRALYRAAEALELQSKVIKTRNPFVERGEQVLRWRRGSPLPVIYACQGGKCPVLVEDEESLNDSVRGLIAEEEEE